MTHAPRATARTVAVAATAALAVAGCSGTTDASATDDLLAPYGLDGLAATAVIDQLDRLPADQRPADLFASVRAEELILSVNGREEVALPIESEDFYVSFAPYVSQTHECFYHSLTTCMGELRNEPIDVTITAGDEVILEETVTTFDNGFYGVWLPADGEFEMTVDYGEYSVTAPVSTGADDPTCITTLQLRA